MHGLMCVNTFEEAGLFVGVDLIRGLCDGWRLWAAADVPTSASGQSKGRSLRGVAVGRKNWMFYGSDQGGRTAAVLNSQIATCKRLRIDPFAYPRDIFERISSHPQSRLAELLPDQWQALRHPAASP